MHQNVRLFLMFLDEIKDGVKILSNVLIQSIIGWQIQVVGNCLLIVVEKEPSSYSNNALNNETLVVKNILFNSYGLLAAEQLPMQILPERPIPVKTRSMDYFPSLIQQLIQSHIILLISYIHLYMNASQPFETIRSAINIFLVVAIAISLLQELNFGGASQSPSTQVKPSAPTINQNGTKVEGLIILTSDSFRPRFKEIMIEKNYNLEIKEFPFEGAQYWTNLFFTHGHMLVVFFLVSRYQAQGDQGRKTKLMMIGMVLVFAWMFGAPYLRTQRLGLQYKGQIVYQKNTFDSAEVAQKLAEYDEASIFDLDPPQVQETVKAKLVEAESQVKQEEIVYNFNTEF